MKSNRTMKVKINKKHPRQTLKNLSGLSICFLWFNFYYPQERVFGDFSDKDIRPLGTPSCLVELNKISLCKTRPRALPILENL